MINNIQQNVPLADLTTFKIGGPADYFYIADNIEETKKVLLWAKEQTLRILILAGGSNMILPDEGFRGLVIRPKFDHLTIKKAIVTVESGYNLQELIRRTLEIGLTGLECVAGVPGTIGGAVVGNAGMYGVDMSSVVEKISYIDLDKLKVTAIAAAEAGFSYRHSKLKEMPVLVTEVVLKLKIGDIAESKKIIAERIAMRQEKLPLEPSAGCIFKNVLLADVDLDKLHQADIDTEQFVQFGKIPTGFLIDHLGLKGFSIGGAQVTPKHANYIVNIGSATAEDVIKLISAIKQKVRDTFGIQLQEEVRVIYN